MADPRKRKAAQSQRPLQAKLTRREGEVFELMVRGLTNGEIAPLLGVAPDTVKYHTLRIFEKLGVSNRTEAVGLYAQQALQPTVSQIPAAPRSFVGRTSELEALDRAARDPSRTACAIHGMGGVGKTALALEFAGRASAAFADGQIYLDLRGTREALDPAQAMLHVVRAIQPSGPILETAAEIAGAYRSVLCGKRVLLVMDDAESREQVEPLVPPEGCLLVVTSRRRIVLPGMLSLEIVPLPPGDARQLIAVLSPRADAVGGELSRLCAGLPLALVLAGRTLGERPDLDPATYAEQLADDARRIEHLDRDDAARGVEASFGLSFQMLEEDLRGQLVLASLFPQDFASPAAAAVWGLDAASADRQIGRLLGYHLLEWRGRPGRAPRYQLHDLVRLFAGGRIDEALRLEGQERHAAHFLDVTREIAASFHEGGRAEAALRLDEEWENIRSGFAFCVSRAETSEVATRRCADYVAAAAPLLELRLHPKQRLEWLAAGIRAASQVGDAAAEVELQIRSGQAYVVLGQFRTAISHYERCARIARESANEAAESRILRNMGRAYSGLGQPRESLKLYQQSLDSARRTGRRGDEARAVGSLSLACHDLGEAAQAIAYGEQNLAIARELGDRAAEGAALASLGSAHSQFGDAKHALELYHRALEIKLEHKDRRGEGQILGSIGLAHFFLGEHRRSVEFSTQFLAIARELGDPRGESQALGNLGLAYEALGQIDRAIELHAQDVALSQRIGDLRGEGRALGNLGLAHASAGQVDRAIALYQQSLARAREVGDRNAESNALGNLALAYREQEQPHRAIDSLAQCIEAKRAVGDERAEVKALCTMAELKVAIDDREAAEEALTRAADVARSLDAPEVEARVRRTRARLAQGLGPGSPQQH